MNSVAKTTVLTLLVLVTVSLANGQKISVAQNHHESVIMLREGPIYLLINSRGILKTIKPELFKTENICIYYDVSGRIKRLDNTSVGYDTDGSVSHIGDTGIGYDLEGRIRQIGTHGIDYDKRGRIRRVGSKRVEYGLDGRIRRVGRINKSQMRLLTHWLD